MHFLFLPQTPYRSLLLSDRTTAEELIQLVLHCNHSQETPADFCLYEVSRTRSGERRVGRKEIPLRLQQEWPGQDLVMFRLKRAADSVTEREEDLPIRRPCPWSRVIDETRVSLGYKLRGEAESTSGSSDSLSTVRSTTASSSSTHSSSSDYDNFYL